MKDETHLRNFGTLSPSGTPLHGTFDKATGQLLSHSAENTPPYRPCDSHELNILVKAYHKAHPTK